MTMKTSIAERLQQSGFAGMKRSDVIKSLEMYTAQIAQALPKHIKPERIISMTVDVMERNPKLKECSVPSVLGSLMQAAVLGFKPSPALGECYFIPYGKECQFQIGYRGWLSLARRSGEIKTVFAECVYANDTFKRSLGLWPTLEHDPAEGDRGAFIGVYAVVHYLSGGYNFVYLTKSEVEKLRQRNPFQKSSPTGAWLTDYDDMAKAKAIKKLKAYLPLGEEAESDEQVITPENFKQDQSGALVLPEYAENQEAQVITDPPTDQPLTE